MVRADEEYVFEGPQGKATLADLFAGRRQLIVQHVMFAPDWDAACPGCTASIDELSDGVLTHLRSRDTAFALVSRAPLAKLQKYQASRGWTAAWYSSHDSDFNYDFQATLDRVAPGVQLPDRAGDRQWRHHHGRGARPELLPARRRRHLPHLLDLCARHRQPRRHLLAAGPDGAGPAGRLGGAQGTGAPPARGPTFTD